MSSGVRGLTIVIGKLGAAAKQAATDLNHLAAPNTMSSEDASGGDLHAVTDTLPNSQNNTGLARQPLFSAVQQIEKKTAKVITDAADAASKTVADSTNSAVKSLDRATQKTLDALTLLQQFATTDLASEAFDPETGSRTGGAVTWGLAYQFVQQFAALLALKNLDPAHAVQRERDEQTLSRLFTEWFGPKLGRIEDLAKQLLAQQRAAQQANQSASTLAAHKPPVSSGAPAAPASIESLIIRGLV